MEQMEHKVMEQLEKASYEIPAVVELGEFATETGFLFVDSNELGVPWPLYLW